MKTHSILFLLIAACSLTSVATLAESQPAGADASDQAIQKAVLDTNAKMVQAANSLNVDGFFDYILDSDKCVIIQNGVVFKTRQEALEAVKAGFKGVAKMDRKLDNPQVTVISPDTALLASEGSVTATLTDGRVMNARFAVSLIFVRKGADWKLLHGHYSMPMRN